MKIPLNEISTPGLLRLMRDVAAELEARHNAPAVHHVREGQGMAQRASNWLTVPLCAQHHTGSKDGWHGQREAWKRAGVDEMDALADTVERLAHV